MARAQTEKFHEMTLEVETSPGSGIYARLCGLNSRTLSMQHNLETTEVPDCDDESLPAQVERAVISSEATISATGVWAAQSHGAISDWFLAAQYRNIRIYHAQALAGTPQYYTGPALLTQIEYTAARGNKVEATMEIQFDGLPTVTDAS